MMMIFPVANVICVELVLIVISLNSYKTTEAANFKNGKNFQNFVLNHRLLFEINKVSRIFCVCIKLCPRPFLSFFSLSPCKAKMSSPRNINVDKWCWNIRRVMIELQLYNKWYVHRCGSFSFPMFFPVTKICFHRTIWKFPVRDQFNCFTLRI